MLVNTDLKSYYAHRAKEYEQVYQKPERQEDLAALHTLLQNLLAGHDALEIACGTGFWTETVAQTAGSVLATDISDAMLEIAQSKPYPVGRVRFLRADAFTLSGISGRFTAGFAGFWLSHVPKSQVHGFLNCLHEKLSPGGLVVLTDNRYVEGSSTPISRVDEAGNTYQLRQLADGTRHEVLKNFPTEDSLKAVLNHVTENILLTELTYLWCLSYNLPKLSSNLEYL